MATTTRKLADLAQFVANDSTIGTGGIVALDAADVTTGTFATGQVPSLNADKITAGTFDNLRISAGNISQHIVAFDDNKIQTNLALLAFKTAANGSLAKYSLRDQVIDEYETAAGIDAGATTGNYTAGVSYSGTAGGTATGVGGTGGTDGSYGWYKWTATSGTRTFEWTGGAVDYLVVAGGGGAGEGFGGGGGAGGFRTAGGYSLGAATHTITVGGGGAGGQEHGSHSNGDEGDDSSIAGLIVSAGGGGGGTGNAPYDDASAGGSGGGGGSDNRPAGGASPAGQGNVGGAGILNGPAHDGGGGGGAGGAGIAGGAGGVGEDEIMGLSAAASYSFLTAASAGHVDSGARYFAGGGGGGAGPATSAATAGGGGLGGGGAGTNTDSTKGTDGTDGTGGGAGGGGVSCAGAAGGSGIVILRWLGLSVSNLVLQSIDTTAETEPDYADMVMLVEDIGNVAALNVDVKGFISEDSGVTFTQGTLVDEGNWGTNKRILAFHDLDISAQSGTAMCYKITTHNQSSVKQTVVHATSIGWK